MRNLSKRFSFRLSLSILLGFSALLASCSLREKPVVIWTDRAELASYAELFNNTNERPKAIVVYKEKVADSLPPQKGEITPDIVIGKYLENSTTNKHFSSLSSILGRESGQNKIKRADFYAPLLEMGGEKLIPISFNIPLVIFSEQNRDFVSTSYMTNPNEIRDDAGIFNEKNKNGVYTKMGFAPSWNNDFLYLLAKMNRVDFKETKSGFTWNEIALGQTVDYNTSTRRAICRFCRVAACSLTPRARTFSRTPRSSFQILTTDGFVPATASQKFSFQTK